MSESKRKNTYDVSLSDFVYAEDENDAAVIAYDETNFDIVLVDDAYWAKKKIEQAAPDLLAACEGLCSLLVATDNETGSAEYHAAIAAIAKARGTK